MPHTAADPLFQHILDTYESETRKSVSIWSAFTDDDLAFRPHPKSSAVAEILKHQLLSERRFFAEFLGLDEPPAAGVLPSTIGVAACIARLQQHAAARLDQLATRGTPWWLETVPFFAVPRQRIWIFWRRVLHTAHHRAQLTVYLRLLDKPVPSTYGPTADVTWDGADPTLTLEATGRPPSA